jgi:hypothetical protein
MPLSQIRNSGVIVKQRGNGVTNILPLVVNKGLIVNRGGLNIPRLLDPPPERVEIDAGAIMSVANGFELDAGALYGSGTLIANAQSSGEVDPGTVGSPGILTITGNYAQTTSVGTGTLNIDLAGTTAGTGFDQLNISGSANLAGTLNLNLVPGYIPNIGDSFKILTYASYTGGFSTITGLTFNGGTERFNVQYNPTNVTLVVVTNSSGSAPTVTSLGTTSGSTAGGTSVSITGTGFTGAYAVSFGSIPAASFTVNSDTSITATAPAQAAGTVDVRVTTVNGTSVTGSGDQFTYIAAPLPAISSISPSSGDFNGGTPVTITGSNFTSATRVMFGSVAATSFTVVSSTSITATAPAQAAGTVDVRVTTYSGTSSVVPADQFTYTSAGVPTVTGVSPSSGSSNGGTVVTLSGTNFVDVGEVDFGSVPTFNFTVNSNGSLTVVAPPNAAGTVDISVVTATGISLPASGDRFTYTAASAPTVSALSVSSGSTAGVTPVVITGTGLSGVVAVLFGTTPATFTINTDSSITAMAPPQAAGTVDITVLTPTGSSATSSADQFTYNTAAAPSVTAVTPFTGSAAGGTPVTVSGSGFTGATAVNFGTVAATSFTVLSDTLLTAVAPPQAAATVDLTVTTYGGTSSTGTADHFTYTAASAPSVSAVTPSSGSTLGGTVVTVIGSGFTGASAVNFGSVAAIDFIVLSDTALTAIAPAQAAATVDIQVVTPSGTSSAVSADHFTYTTASAPAVTSIGPSSGSTGGGTVVSVLGSGFTGTTGVSFGGVAATGFAVYSDTLLTAVAPPNSAGVWDIQVTNPSGTSAPAATDRFTYTAASAPSVSSLGVSSGSSAGGTQVKVTGSGFTGASGVAFGTVSASFIVVSDTTLIAFAPPQAAATVDVIVTSPTGTSAVSSSDQFTYNAASLPTVSAITPTSGSTAGGTVVTVTGTGFTGASAVSFGTTPASGFTVLSDTTLLAIAPPQAAGTVDLTATTPSGQSSTSSSDQFTYNAASAPSVTGITPSSGPLIGGTLVTILGSNFTGATAVSFGTQAAVSFTVVSDTALTAVAPIQAAAGAVDVTVTTYGGTSSTGSADRFTYTYTAGSAPTVTGISPTSGSTAGGTAVTVSGTGFTGATAVKFGSTAATSFTVLSDTQLTATAPAGSAGMVDITVTTGGGTSSTGSADQFTYVSTPVPIVTHVSPGTGTTAGGTSVTITGNNFSSVSGVSFGNVAASSYTVNSSIQITATAPPQAVGVVDITVTTASGTSVPSPQDLFSYTPAPVPAVTSLGTTSGGTAGGIPVIINGGNFTGAYAVSFGSVPAASFTINSASQITALLPAQAAGTIDVTVSTYSGTSALSSSDRFSYTASAVASISSISPSSGSTAGGTSVSLTGSGFTSATGVNFGNTPATSFTVNSDTSITAVAPPQAAGTVDITVTTFSGISVVVSADQFTYTAASVPAVNSVSPSSGSTAGGTSVTIGGSAFTGATGVMFGTVAATSFTVNSDTSITATAPPEAAATVDVRVTTYAGTSATSSSDHFTYNAAPAPTVSGITPASGPSSGGTVVVITGSNFTGATAVSFGTIAATSFTINSDSSITAVAPAQTAATVDVTVTTYSATSATGSADRFTYNAVALPTVTSISPSSGNTGGGAVVLINGTNLSSVGAVYFGTVPAVSFTVYSDSLLTAVAPPQAAGIWDITVVNATGSSAAVAADRFTYSSAPTPAVTSISPASASTGGGTVVTITGSGFTGPSAVAFGGTPAASFTVVSDTTILATSPAHASGTVDITVTSPTGTSAVGGGDQFTYNAVAAPTVSGVSPSSGSTAGGTVVIVTGTNLTGATGVWLGTAAAASFTVLSDTQLLAVTAPQAAGTVDLTVTTPSGTSSAVSADHFTFNAASAPSITGITPSSGPASGGTVVVLTGSNFTGATAVNFGSVAATSFQVNSDTSITATAPAQAAAVEDITVTSPSGMSSTGSADRFTYTSVSAPTITSLAPTSGSTAGGTVVTLTGTNFSGALNVSFGSVAALSFSVISATSIVAVAPPQAAGTVDTTVTTPGGTTALSSADHFTYSAATAPSVTSISPTSGTTAGGTVVTVTGSHFTGASAVTFGSVAATSFTALTDTTLLAVAPPEAAATVDLQVTTPSGISSAVSGDHYTYNTASVPSVTAIAPTSGSIAGGTVVYVSGSNFTGTTGVSFGSTAASAFTVLSDTLLTATAPAEPTGTVDIKVTTYAGTSTAVSADRFTFTSPEEAAGGAVALRPGAEMLTADVLGPLVAEALVLWAAAGVDPAQLNILSTAQVQVADLPAPYLGLTGAGIIQLDREAAGYGWFIDPTPATAEEFQDSPDHEFLLAPEDSPAAGRMDLLTVVVHEMGHLLGLDDVPVAQEPGDVMGQALEPGVRKLPAREDVRKTGTSIITTLMGATNENVPVGGVLPEQSEAPSKPSPSARPELHPPALSLFDTALLVSGSAAFKASDLAYDSPGDQGTAGLNSAPQVAALVQAPSPRDLIAFAPLLGENTDHGETSNDPLFDPRTLGALFGAADSEQTTFGKVGLGV